MEAHRITSAQKTRHSGGTNPLDAEENDKCVGGWKPDFTRRKQQGPLRA
jgi:hypothetical protein